MKELMIAIGFAGALSSLAILVKRKLRKEKVGKVFISLVISLIILVIGVLLELLVSKEMI